MRRPLRVAVVGAGPSGMYASGHLLEGPGGTFLDGCLQSLVNRPVEVDVFERLPMPFGLLRYGVAPDHQDKKRLERVFEGIAARKGFRLFANVELGKHVQAEELAVWYDAVIHAVGASGDKPLGIPGESLDGALSAREFVLWYNGHPDLRERRVDLSRERVVVVGNGNVALDVARILCLPVRLLAKTDIADHALSALSASAVREVVILGRRGVQDAAFSNAELEELCDLPDVDVLVDDHNIDWDTVIASAAGDSVAHRKVSTLRALAKRPIQDHPRRLVFRFMTSPVALRGEGRVEGVDVECHGQERPNQVDAGAQREFLSAGMVLRAVGFRGVRVPGLPFDDARGVLEHADGRVLRDGKPWPGQYVTGWARRGPRGILGTNKKCARDVVRTLLADADAGRLPEADTLSAQEVEARIRRRQPAFVDRRQWLRMDALERWDSRAEGRPRVENTTWTVDTSAVSPWG